MSEAKKLKLKIAIASGKGGVGKSMLASTLATLFAEERKIVAVDCDADTPNLAVWLGSPENWEKIKKVSVSEKPIILNKKLTRKEAKACVAKCKFGALQVENGKLKLNSFLCEGCGACEFFCPKGIAKMRAVKSGEVKIKKIWIKNKFNRKKYNFVLVSGQLFPGESGSGKIVDQIKTEAEKFNPEIMLIDSAPGTGCPVTAALRDVNFAVLITEPSLSGFSDLKRVLAVVNYFKISYGIVINKWDINSKLSNKIEKWAGNKMLGKISYDKKIFQTIANLIPILETSLKAKTEIKTIYKNLLKIL